MTSEAPSKTPPESPSGAFVWAWLPGATDPVVGGRLEAVGDILNFNYGQSYLGRADAIPLYLPELPLASGIAAPPSGMEVAGCIADAGPDAWGKRVIMRRILGTEAVTSDPATVGPLVYLLESGSDRIGGLDFQASSSEYVARKTDATLTELLAAAERVEQGVAFSPELDMALLHGSSIGGARPKALLTDGGRALIAKFSATNDAYPIAKGEFAAMELARRAGLDVAPVSIENVLGKDVLLIERFDRLHGTGERRMMVSALTILGLGEMFARYASYADLAHVVRERFSDARATLRELFARITFSILAGNNDDHARNHAAFWDGEQLTLTPAFDICPQPRGGGETAQAMAIGEDGFRMSQVEGCVRAASTYLLSEAEARAVIDGQIAAIEDGWNEVTELARMTEVERKYFWRRQFLNPYALQDYVSGR